MANAIDMIKSDHKRVKGLFKEFDKADKAKEKERVVRETLKELTTHATLEEEIFYPAVRMIDGMDKMMDEAEEEHHLVKLLIMELARMRPSDSHYEAKFSVLRENVEHHIEEEEAEVLRKAEQLGQERLSGIGQQMQSRKPAAEKEAEGVVKGNVMATGKAAAKAAREAVGRR
ncbi:MAG TPA: hemerythrin domain-containing protein [Dehalococcoidia bacterium]|nr:hemerythrin domain-containing protein [Dehalococcoidia bacterium]